MSSQVIRNTFLSIQWFLTENDRICLQHSDGVFAWIWMVNFVHRCVFGAIPVWLRGWFVLSGENDNETYQRCWKREDVWYKNLSKEQILDYMINDGLIPWKYFTEISTHYLVVIKMKQKYDHVDMTGPSRQGLSVVSTIDHLMGAILEVCTLYGVLG